MRPVTRCRTLNSQLRLALRNTHRAIRRPVATQSDKNCPNNAATAEHLGWAVLVKCASPGKPNKIEVPNRHGLPICDSVYSVGGFEPRDVGNWPPSARFPNSQRRASTARTRFNLAAIEKAARPDWRKSSNLRSSSSVQILLFFNAIDESTLVDGSSPLAQGGFLRVWRLSQGLRMGDWLRIHWLASPHVGVFKQRPHVGSSVAAGLTGGSTVSIPQIMRTGRKRMLRKRGGQPGNQNAVTLTALQFAPRDLLHLKRNTLPGERSSACRMSGSRLSPRPTTPP